MFEDNIEGNRICSWIRCRISGEKKEDDFLGCVLRNKAVLIYCLWKGCELYALVSADNYRGFVVTANQELGPKVWHIGFNQVSGEFNKSSKFLRSGEFNKSDRGPNVRTGESWSLTLQKWRLMFKGVSGLFLGIFRKVKIKPLNKIWQ